MRRRTLAVTALAAGLAACLIAGGCSGGGQKAASSLGPVAGSPSPVTPGASVTPSALTSAEPTSASTPATTLTHGTQSGGGKATTVPTIAVKVYPLPDLITNNCPHTFDVKGKISVSAGPIDLTYGWQDGPGQLVHDTKKIHFGGAGAQSKNVSIAVAAVGIHKDYTENLVVTDHLYTASPGGVTFMITCGLTVSTPVPTNPHVTCGGTTTFTATVHTAATRSVQAQWRFSDGSATGAFTVTALADHDTTIASSQVTVVRNPADLRGRFFATLNIVDDGTDEHQKVTGSVTCVLPNH